jgi:two-component system, NarL family, nitrate/nitrite response regulator NarL
MAGEKARVLVVDDHDVVLNGIQGKLAEHPEFEICGFARDGLEALAKAEALRPDIMIMDISMPKMNGVTAAREIRRISEDIRIIIFSMHSTHEYVSALVQLGVSAYVLKSAPIADLISAVKAVRDGGRYFCEPIRKILGHETA